MAAFPHEQAHGLVLASTSPWRRQLLEEAGLPCLGVAPEVDEEAIEGRDPVDTARARARAKAQAVAVRYPEHLVLGADQVLWLPWDGAPVFGAGAAGAGAAGAGGEAIGKPRDEADWLARLRELRGRSHLLTTAVAIVAPPSLGGEEELEVTTRVRLRADLEDAELRAYVAWGEARGCAGGYMVEQRGAWLIEACEGDWYNVIGLPILPLVGRLRARGWRLDADGRARPGAGLPGSR